MPSTAAPDHAAILVSIADSQAIEMIQLSRGLNSYRAPTSRGSLAKGSARLKLQYIGTQVSKCLTRSASAS
jgi:hypothetical protein